jgi:RHS repeat-associated protein
LQNLNVSLNVPVMSKNGAFAFTFALVGGDSNIYSNGTSLEPGVHSLPLAGVANGILGYQGNYLTSTDLTPFTCANGTGTAAKFSGFALHFADGTLHPFVAGDSVISSVAGYPGDCPTSLTATTLDGSGYTISVTGCSTDIGCNLYTVNSISTRSGTQISNDGIPATITDPNGNSISYNAVSGVYTDTLGVSTLTATAGTLPTVSWTDVSGGSPTVTPTSTSYTLRSAFGCSSQTDYNLPSQSLPTSIGFPDLTTLGLTYEVTPGYSSDRTGRWAALTLRGGGTVTYNWNPPNAAHDGLNCTYLVPTQISRTTSDGTTSYTLAFSQVSGNNYSETDTAVDQGGNNTVYTFTGLTATGNAAFPVIQARTQVQHYQGSISSSNLLATDVYCYNAASGQPGNCSTAVVSGPVTEVDVYHTIPNLATGSSRTQTQYDGGPTGSCATAQSGCYGNVTYSAQYDFGASSPTLTSTMTYGSWNGSTCVAVSSTIHNKPCQVVTTQGGNTIAYVRFKYSSTGNLLTSYVSPNGGSSFLSNTTANVYNSNGTISTSYDLAGKETTYAYSSGGYTSCGSCTNYPFPTSVTKGGLTTSSTWNGVGGVKLSDVGPNGISNQKTTYGYVSSSGAADPFWRVMSVTDPLLNVVWNTYPSGSSPDTEGSSLSFNSGSSVQNTTVTLDGYGRKVNVQAQQGPGATNYDTISTLYTWGGTNNDKRLIATNIPCTTTLNATCGNTNQMFIDVLGRTTWTSTPATGEYVSTQYTENDVLSTLGPASTGENLKEVQKQYDGLGRLTSNCKISSTVNGSVSCGQNTNTSLTGELTSITYTPGSGSQTVSSTRGAQTRSKTVDGLGRVTSTTTPEGGTTTNIYDSVAANYCAVGAYSSPGDLVAKADANGNHVCYYYDALHRLTDVGNNNQSTTNACKRFRYDSPANGYVSQPTGATFTNTSGRLVEAETDAGGMITDEWFSYDKDGNITDMWEWTPHSGQYYHSTATFAGNGIVTSLQLASPSLYTITYGLDGEGRWNTLAKGTTTMVTGPLPPTPMYNAAGEPIEVDFTGSDKDVYTYNAYSGNMTQYEFQVGSGNETGVLNWNPNNTLQSVAITDGFNSGGSQTCSSSYDDLSRLGIFDCGSGNWGQDFGYDQYDNLTQTVISGRSGSTWNPGYSTSPSNNHVSGATYDAGGNMTNDGGMNVYGYDAYDKLLWTAGSGTPTCGTTGKCITYDAFGRMVEKSSATAWSEIWYTQVPGSLVNMSGTTANYGYWPSPGRGTFVASGSNIFFHQDWIGNDRVVSNLGSNTVAADRAYAPYGEQYNTFGSTNPIYGMFAGLTGDFDSGVLLDTPNRELAQYQGRWLTPDPAGAGWNQYAYVTNPNSQIDPSGLDCIVDCDDPGGGGSTGGVGGGGGTDPSGGGCDPDEDPYCIPNPIVPPGGGGWSGGGRSGGVAGPGTVVSPSSPNDPGNASMPSGVTPECEFGFCNPFGNGLVEPTPDQVEVIAPFCVIQPEVCFIIIVSVYEAIKLGPGIVDSIKNLAKGGPQNVADTGVLEQAQQMVASGQAKNICDALQQMYDRTPPGPQRNKIKSTQKAKKCRPTAGGN